MAVSLLSSLCCRIGYNPKENSLCLFKNFMSGVWTAAGRAGSVPSTSFTIFNNDVMEHNLSTSFKQVIASSPGLGTLKRTLFVRDKRFGLYNQSAVVTLGRLSTGLRMGLPL
jgi:hypothetical protein